MEEAKVKNSKTSNSGSNNSRSGKVLTEEVKNFLIKKYKLYVNVIQYILLLSLAFFVLVRVESHFIENELGSLKKERLELYTTKKKIDKKLNSLEKIINMKSKAIDHHDQLIERFSKQIQEMILYQNRLKKKFEKAVALYKNSSEEDDDDFFFA